MTRSPIATEKSHEGAFHARPSARYRRSIHWLVRGSIWMGMIPAVPAFGQAPDSALEAARSFYQAMGARRWEGVAARVHPDRLAIVRSNLTSMVEAETGHAVLSELLGLSSRAEFDRARDVDLFGHVLATLERRIPSLAAVLATNEVQLLGAVPDGEAQAHVVVRVTPYADGSRPSWVRVVSLRRGLHGWGVFEAEELNSVLNAVLGLPLNR